MQNVIGRAVLAILLFVASGAAAGEHMGISQVKIGQPLPPVSLDGKAGELQIAGGNIDYRPWSSTSLKGRVHLLYIVAARMRIDKVNQSLLDALQAAGGVEAFPEEVVKVISLINIDDVFPMGAGFARHAFEEARRSPENAHAIFVLDDRSAVQRAWGLKRKSAAVIVLDSEGRVRRFKDGALSEPEIQDFIQVLESLRDGESEK